MKGRKHEEVKSSDEDSINKESMRRHIGYGKDFHGRLAPLRRWLESQVGRPWNDIYSEACRTVDKRSIAGWHFIDYLLNMVYIKTETINGKVHSWDGYGLDREIFPNDLYVDADCILRKYKANQPRYSRSKKAYNPNVRKVNDFLSYKRINGAWFELSYRKFTESIAYDVEQKKSVYNKVQHNSTWGIPWWETTKYYCWKKRQLSKKEIRDLGLNKNVEF